MEIVFDSSTLILLAKIELLREIMSDNNIIIPERVERECLIKESLDAKLISELINEKSIEVKKVDDMKTVKKIKRDFRIDSGEAEALLLAKKFDYPLAVDDGPTIKACKIINQRFITAIHFLLNCTSKNKIQSEIAIIKLEKLTTYGRYNRKIIEEAKKHIKGGKI